VAVDAGGNVFAVNPLAGGGHLAQIEGGAAHDLISRLAGPQGVVIDDAGNLFLSEEDAGRVDLLVRSFKIEPLASATPAPGHALCIDIFRAPGFAGDVELTGSPGLRVVQQPGSGSQGAVLVSGCHVAPCEVVARSGNSSDLLWISA
jgi:hypothetical protein